MANSNGWGDGSVNNNIGWGQGAVNNNISWGKSQITSWSGATDIDGGNAPVNTVAPAITGTAQEGQTLTCSTGTWSGSPTYTYQWKRNGSNIGSATNSTYLLVTADVGQSILCTVTATNALGSSNANSNTVTPTSSVDSDAQAFITAASITDPTQQSAINQLVVDLKGYNIWTKMKALYPFVGGTSSNHKWNLKDPRDLDAAFRLVFSGGWTHSANGALPNGTNGYADTFFKPSNSDYTNFNWGYYLRTNSINNVEFGMIEGILVVYDYPKLDSNGYTRYGSGEFSFSGGDTRGFHSWNQVSNQLKRFKNGSLTNTFSNTPNNLSSATISYYVAARNQNGTAVGYSNRERAFQYICDGLTNTEAANLYTAVQAFQTTLGRQV